MILKHIKILYLCFKTWLSHL